MASFLSDREIEASYLTACAGNIQWLLDEFHTERNQLVISGWAIADHGRPKDARFLLNGIPFEEADYPIVSPDVGEFFWNVPAAQTARFVCRTGIDWHDSFPEGFACPEFLPAGADREQVRRRAWYLPNPKTD